MPKYYLIRARHSGKVLTVNGDYNWKTNIVQSDETRADNQLFEIRPNPNGSGNFQIVCKGNPGYSFGIHPGVNAIQGEELRIDELDHRWMAKSRLFYFIPQEDGYCKINVKYDYSDIASSGPTSMDYFKALEEEDQDAYLAAHEGSKGRYYSGYVLSVEYDSYDNGTRIIQWSSHGGWGQLFKLEAVT